MLYGFVTLRGHFFQSLLCIVEKCNFSLLPYKLLLELFVLLEQEMECILQVLVTIDEHFVILVEIVDQVLDKEQVISVKWR